MSDRQPQYTRKLAVQQHSFLSSRLAQIDQRIGSTQAEINELERELKAVTEAVAVGKATIDEADKIGSALDAAKQRLEADQTMYSKTEERMQSINIDRTIEGTPRKEEKHERQ